MRLEKDCEAARAVMACKNLSDMASIQSRWMDETLRDYHAEITKLMSICTKSANSSVGPKE